MARPTKLTKALLERFEEVATGALTITDACTDLGITRETYRAWREKGEADIEAGRKTTLPARFSDIAQAVPSRRKNAVTSALYARALTGHPEACRLWLTLVERIPAPSSVQVSGPEGGPIQTSAELDLTKLSPEQLHQLHTLTALAERSDQETTPG